MLVYGLISPHPPIIIPEIGQDQIAQVKSTIDALDQAARQLAASRPEELIIISPHEQHGFDVPLYYLKKYLPQGIKLQKILVTEPSYQYYYDYGRQMGEKVRAGERRYAIVASADLSHVLRPEGPYGYHPSGPGLDKLIVQAVRAGDAPALLAIDPAVLDKGAECGLRSILFLLGSFAGTDSKIEVLSYEGPFGVGYLVATLTPSTAGNLTGLARAAIAHYLQTKETMTPPKTEDAGSQRKSGAFVSLHDLSGELRGCIGTVEATKDTVAEEVIANAIAAATGDPRFVPVQAHELAGLTISVDVLSSPTIETNIAKLDPKTDGLVVTATDGRRGVLLPDLAGIETAQEQITICREKAGIGPEEPIQIAKFQVERQTEI